MATSRLPPGEARAVALLVAAQFRFDQRFRMAILGMVPLIGFYLLLGLNDGALVDPFTPDAARSGGTPLYMAIVFMPMTLHASLQVSDCWRAAWMFFATPASAARLIVAAKNYRGDVLPGGLPAVPGGVWTFFYERIWHALFHAAVIGCLAHMLLQLMAMVAAVAAVCRRTAAVDTLVDGATACCSSGSVIAAILPMGLPLSTSAHHHARWPWPS